MFWKFPREASTSFEENNCVPPPINPISSPLLTSLLCVSCLNLLASFEVPAVEVAVEAAVEVADVVVSAA